MTVVPAQQLAHVTGVAVVLQHELAELHGAGVGERTPLREALTECDAERDADAVTLKPRVGDRDGDGVGDTSTHCTYSANTAPPAPQPPDTVSAVLGVMEHEFWPRHVALTTATFVAAPGHDPRANGPDGHAPVGLP